MHATHFSQGFIFSDLQLLFKIFSEVTHLRNLDISSCGLGLFNDEEPLEETGISEFIKLFGHFLMTTSLRELDLSNNEFSRVTTIKLLSYVFKNPHLSITLNQNGLSTKEIEEFRKASQKPVATDASGLKKASAKPVLIAYSSEAVQAFPYRFTQYVVPNAKLNK